MLIFHMKAHLSSHSWMCEMGFHPMVVTQSPESLHGHCTSPVEGWPLNCLAWSVSSRPSLPGVQYNHLSASLRVWERPLLTVIQWGCERRFLKQTGMGRSEQNYKIEPGLVPGT